MSPTQAEAKQARARVLILHGAADTHVSDEDLHRYLEALRPTDIDWQLFVYAGAKHSFTNPKADSAGIEGVGYQERAAKRSWRQMRMFLAEIFGQSITLDSKGH